MSDATIAIAQEDRISPDTTAVRIALDYFLTIDVGWCDSDFISIIRNDEGSPTQFINMSAGTALQVRDALTLVLNSGPTAAERMVTNE